MLGPDRMMPVHRRLLKATTYKTARLKFLTGTIDWSDRSLTKLRTTLRSILRNQQDGRCFYCRQSILLERRNVYEDIEHYLDKSKGHYRRWAFSPVNLVLACRACNFVKGARDLGDAAVAGSISLTATAGSFRWVHPYFDNYHSNIKIENGWVYSVQPQAPKPDQALRLIEDLELDKIERIHRARYLRDRYVRRTNAVAARCIDQGNLVRARRVLEIQKAVLDTAAFS